MRRKNLKDNESDIIGVSAHIKDVRKSMSLAATEDMTVLIQGPTGTGKELIAKGIHEKSKRKEKPLEIVNCGAIPAELLESELFGHEKGAFTGASYKKDGRIKRAEGGTLFFDEIGDLRSDHQVKILRFLNDKKYSPVGGTETQADVRVIAATNKNLLAEMRNGTFREDLYYRLNQYQINTVPLAGRREDVVCLVNHFAAHDKLKIDPKMKLFLYSYEFPGNVRQLISYLKVYETTNNYYDIVQQMQELIITMEPEEGDEQNQHTALFDPGTLKKKHPRKTELDYANCFVWKCDDQDIKKCVEAYEIIKLYQAGLPKEDIAQILRIRVQKLTPGEFKKKFGFNFPYRKDPYYVDRPLDVYPFPKTFIERFPEFSTLLTRFD